MKLRIIMTTCKRCGKPVATANRSIIGAHAAKAKWERICHDCATDEERREMLRDMGIEAFGVQR